MSTELEVLLSSTARVEILRLFLLNPDRQFYQREIERETGQPIRAVQREVERLEGIGLLLRSAEGNRVFYRLNPDFALLAELMALFEKAVGGEEMARTPGRARTIPPEPSSVGQPFAWMETPSTPPLPEALRRLQVEGEWDQAY
jgi:DNA-binding transcriptional ArsR family regulator